MTPADFTTWLRGFMAACGESLTGAQLEMVRAELAKVVAAPTFTLLPQPIFVPYQVPAPPVWPTYLPDVICCGGAQLTLNPEPNGSFRIES